MIRILIPLDGSTAAEEALKHGLSIAETFPAEITLLRIIEPPEGSMPTTDCIDFALWRHQAQFYLDDLLNRYSSEGTPIRCLVADGRPATMIVQYMKKLNADLVVLTRYGRGNAQDFTAGGTALKIIAAAECSVLLVDPQSPKERANRINRIFVPIDQSKDADCAVAIATMIAEINQASLILAYVTEEPLILEGISPTKRALQLTDEMHRIVRQEADRRLRELAAKIPDAVDVQTRVLISPDSALAIESAVREYDCDLLLLHADAPHRYSAMNQSLIQHTHVPLFILRPNSSEGFASNFRSIYLGDDNREAG